MKVALVYPQEYKPEPWLDPDWEDPIGLGYIGAIAQQMGHEAKLFVPIAESIKELTDLVVEWKPDVVAMQLYTCQVPVASRMMRDIRNRIDTIIIAGGPHPTAISSIVQYDLKRHWGSPYNLAIIGEGEKTFFELLATLDEVGYSRKNFREIPGLAFMAEGVRQKLVQTKPRPRIENLDELPFPIKTDPRLYKYKRGGPCSLYFPAPSECVWASIITSRGCNRKCSFCSSSRMWRWTVKYRSPANVLEEIRYLQEEYEVNSLFFEDLTFSHNPRKVAELCEYFIKNKLDISWWCQTTVASADPGLFSLMRKAGCRTVAFGIESFDNEGLRRMGKRGQTETNIKRALEMAVDAGLMTWGYYIIGFPWETEESILHDAEKMIELPLHRLRLSIATPLPGSEWFDKMTYEKSSDWSEYDTNHLVYDHPTLKPDRLKDIQREIFQRFYRSRSYGDRVAEMVKKHPELKDSFDAHLTYVAQFI